MPFRAVLFDLDGTLIDSVADIAASTNRMLATNGFPQHPSEAFTHFIGDGVRNLVLRALPPEARKDTALVDRCILSYSQDYRHNWCVKTALYPGIAPMLDGLVARGLKLTVLSNKPDEFTQACGAHFLTRWKFDLVMGASDHFPHKPDPAAALSIAEHLQIAPSNFLYLGDMAVDMQTATNAGMIAVGATWGLRSKQELIAAGAPYTIDKPLQLLELADQT